MPKKQYRRGPIIVKARKQNAKSVTASEFLGNVEDLQKGAEEAVELIKVEGRKEKLRSFHEVRLKRYHRTKDYWQFWDEQCWNPGPFRNRNRNNMFVASFSSVSSP